MGGGGGGVALPALRVSSSSAALELFKELAGTVESMEKAEERGGGRLVEFHYISSCYRSNTP